VRKCGSQTVGCRKEFNQTMRIGAIDYEVPVTVLMNQFARLRYRQTYRNTPPLVSRTKYGLAQYLTRLLLA
jgi:hypothetical protein